MRKRDLIKHILELFRALFKARLMGGAVAVGMTRRELLGMLGAASAVGLLPIAKGFTGGTFEPGVLTIQGFYDAMFKLENVQTEPYVAIVSPDTHARMMRASAEARMDDIMGDAFGIDADPLTIMGVPVLTRLVAE